MGKFLNFMLVATATALVVACANQQFYEENDVAYNEPVPNSLQMQIVWSKNKEQSMDLMVKFVNQYNKPVLVKNIILQYQGVKVGPSEATQGIELQSGQTMEKLFVFRATNRKRTDDAKAELSVAVLEGSLDKVGSVLPPIKKSFKYCSETSLFCQ